MLSFVGIEGVQVLRVLMLLEAQGELVEEVDELSGGLVGERGGDVEGDGLVLVVHGVVPRLLGLEFLERGVQVLDADGVLVVDGGGGECVVGEAVEFPRHAMGGLV